MCTVISIDAICYIASFFYIFRHGWARYNACTMQVYAEYALLENFCMDFMLLYCAKAATKNPAKYFRLFASSVLGASFAVVYPLFGVGGAVGIAIKLAVGGAMCAVAGKYQSFKGYIKFTAAFCAVSFAIGGGLIAIFSLAGVAYEEGSGFLLSSVPVGIPAFAVVIAAILIKKLKSKVVAARNIVATCRFYSGEKCAVCTGFYDSGNKVYCKGAPVSIVPKAIAEKLTEIAGIKTCVDIHTVAGKSLIKVFTADKLEIDDGKSVITRSNVTLGVAPHGTKKVVLHPDLSEVN